ncbi:GntR family transcriptional regulator of arabinose operon [Caldalkalibacillus uzonensis]|uniref:GntR family transcriptional regulator of arabinose operon n=1 Tax=Caldalkalibacillus uzonensis TaxID=353224 RepID=A0ABU0CRX8_9BACI|nr:GntR family transcriptional regulator [Caldalkalibacillus uzonensis]MDQ0338626.1 GntR family transcriptional regulator of arabinose operon [Caldalkalibacillus uzonensis]
MKQKQLPKYLQLKQEILSWIHTGRLKPGDQMPTEHDIADQFGMSRQTVRQTLGVLEQEGWLKRIQGKGTFVSQPLPIREKKNNHTIGMVTTYISDYIFPHIVRGAEAALRKKGYHLLLASTDNNKTEERASLQKMLEQPLSGLIIEPTKSALGNPNLHYYLSLEQNHIPYIMINARYPELNCPSVEVDDELGTFLGTEHLIQLGHRKIAGFFKTDDVQGVRRLKGFIRAHQTYHIPLHPESVIQYQTEEKWSKPYETALSLLSQPEERPSALVCYNDELAVHLLEAVRKVGLDIPGDLSIVGFDDSPLATATEVKLTTLTHPKEELGSKAAEMLLNMINRQEKMDAETVVYKPELVVRESTKKIN